MDSLKSKIKIEKWFIGKATWFSGHRYVQAISAGIGYLAPLLLLGGTVLIVLTCLKGLEIENIKCLAFLSNSQFLNIQNEMEYIYKITLGLSSVFFCGGVAYSLSQAYIVEKENIDPFSFSLVAMISFFIISSGVTDSSLNTDYLGANGFLLSMVIAIFTVEVNFYLVKQKLVLTLPSSVPPAISSSFTAILPTIVNLLILGSISIFFKALFRESLTVIVSSIFLSLLTIADTALFVGIIMFATQVLWTKGLHGGAVTGVITSFIYTVNLLFNGEAFLNDSPLPFIMTGPLSVYIVVMGGAGASLGLMFLMIRSQSKHLKFIGKEGMIPSLFGINEPILYGTPLIGNKELKIPFIIVPIVNVFLAYFVIGKGFVGRAYILIPWASPAIIGLPLTTLDFRAVYFVLLTLIIDIGIYYPFFKKYEKKLIESEFSDEIDYESR